ncbi:hypothetical protein OO184_21300 [Photorhabdus sp. APURE]|uniref:hypothetical protein n=1 Tax=Photorhabdus aballayi TaxID=2991723 RepID=UPI00223E11DD|nr:hypothetical protein [Photorhabdus aballayi]MCW7550398.1 hypothetical protein [Photorhabdus aballayi]
MTLVASLSGCNNTELGKANDELLLAGLIRNVVYDEVNDCPSGGSHECKGELNHAITSITSENNVSLAKSELYL